MKDVCAEHPGLPYAKIWVQPGLGESILTQPIRVFAAFPIGKLSVEAVRRYTFQLEPFSKNTPRGDELNGDVCTVSYCADDPDDP